MRGRKVTHGHARRGARTTTYVIWRGMHTRCENASVPAYADYGGRGIRVCERWASFENFLADMGERPPGTTLDRRDNEGDYSLGNCRWASRLEQARNTRSNTVVTISGESKPIAAWLDHYRLSRNTFRSRQRNGWDLPTALSTPAKERT